MVADDVFSHVTTVCKHSRKKMIRNFYKFKGYTAQKLLKEFWDENWDGQSLQKLPRKHRHRFSWQASREW